MHAVNLARKSRLFGDGRNGYRIQIWEVLVNRDDGNEPEETGIVEVAIKESHRHEFKTTVSYKDREFPTLQEAIDQWKEDTKCP